MKDVWRHAIAEFIGTFALVFVGGGAIMSASGNGLLQVALAHGLILAVMVTATMRISGHFNPAITLGFLVARRIEISMAGVYVLAQLLGAMVAAYALRGTFPADVAMAAALGGQKLALGVSYGQGIALEAIATFMLAFVIFGTAVDPQAPRVGGLAIGFTVAAAILMIGPMTGASLNPARSFGPAVVSGVWSDHGVFWIGPIIGGVAGALLYERVFLRHPVEPHDHGAIRPRA
jgi:MIP family channel proteins